MNDSSSVVIIFVTAPEAESAERMARTLVEERLVACVNVVPGIRSHYWWEGEVQSSDEVLLLMKARRSDVAAVAERVKSLHPYSLPEVVAAPIAAGLEAYLDWVRAETERA